MTYDRDRWQAAFARFLDDPRTVTDDDIALFAVVDPRFAARAEMKRAGFMEASEPGDKTPFTVGDFLSWVKDCSDPILATYRHRMDVLEQRNKDFESRLLDLELRKVVTDAER